MRLAEDVADLGTVEQRPLQDGRNMTMLLSPLPKKQAEEDTPAPAADGAAPPAAEAPPEAPAAQSTEAS
jgi:translation initiation factor IF-3